MISNEDIEAFEEPSKQKSQRQSNKLTPQNVSELVNMYEQRSVYRYGSLYWTEWDSKIKNWIQSYLGLSF